MSSRFQCGRFQLALDERPLVMGILNLTPDSFSDGGRYMNLDAALTRAEQMIGDGVDIIDIGAESSRPGAPALPLQQELDRLMPLIYALGDCGKPISVDTYKPEVMREALAAGADMINDINGFRAVGAFDAVADSDAALCIMHMQGEPATMQQNPIYEDVTKSVTTFLRQQVDTALSMGIARNRISLDPGFGFGKTLAHNLQLAHELEYVQQLDLPILIGVSRKSMIGAITGRTVEERLSGSLAGMLALVAKGAQIVRVHDVAASVDALKVWSAVNNFKN